MEEIKLIVLDEDLPKLEQYGFKPLYDEKTGIIKEYYYNAKYSSNSKLHLKKKEIRNIKSIHFKRLYSFRNKKYNNYLGFYYFLHDYENGYAEYIANILYLLIKDNIVKNLYETKEVG